MGNIYPNLWFSLSTDRLRTNPKRSRKMLCATLRNTGKGIKKVLQSWESSWGLSSSWSFGVVELQRSSILHGFIFRCAKYLRHRLNCWCNMDQFVCVFFKYLQYYVKYDLVLPSINLQYNRIIELLTLDLIFMKFKCQSLRPSRWPLELESLNHVGRVWRHDPQKNMA